MLDGVIRVRSAGVADPGRGASAWTVVEDLRTWHTRKGERLRCNVSRPSGALLEDAAASFQGETNAARDPVRHAADDLPLLDIDPCAFAKWSVNLVSNAMRYVADGGAIAIDARVTMAAEVAVTCQITVRDRGCRSAACVRSLLKGRSSSGSGLGLAIAHNLVTATTGRCPFAARREATRPSRSACRQNFHV